MTEAMHTPLGDEIDRLRAINADLVEALDKIIQRATWNGWRQGWDIQCDLPAGTIKAARAAIAKAKQP
jgi:hypothetical protein